MPYNRKTQALEGCLNEIITMFTEYAINHLNPRFFDDTALRLRKQAIAQTVADSLDFISKHLGNTAKDIQKSETPLPPGRVTMAKELPHPERISDTDFHIEYCFKGRPVTLAKAKDHLKSWEDIKPGVLYAEYTPLGKNGLSIKHDSIGFQPEDPRYSEAISQENTRTLFIYYLDAKLQGARDYTVSNITIPELSGKITANFSIKELSTPNLLNKIIEKLKSTSHYEKVEIYHPAPLDNYQCPNLLTMDMINEGLDTLEKSRRTILRLIEKADEEHNRILKDARKTIPTGSLNTRVNDHSFFKLATTNLHTLCETSYVAISAAGADATPIAARIGSVN